MAATKDFSKFNPLDYLQEYYADDENDPENDFLLSFFHDVYGQMPRQKKLLEVGGGPVIYPLISASSKVDEIIFSEFTDENRAAVKNWVQKHPTAFDWSRYFKYVAEMECTSPERIEERLRSRLKKIIKCDISKSNPIAPLSHKDFDILSINFCPESITDDEKDYMLWVRNIVSLLKPEGILVMTMIRNARYYNSGDTKFIACPIDENGVADALKMAGCRITKMQSFDINDPERGYDGLIALTAVKA
ncbi:MAG: guanitoxin biosynthesis pre-guanitoxin forming N-methyltransferase GntF [Candidatus Woesearchaeota archaeon]